MLIKTPRHLDNLDRRILDVLQDDGRISNVALAKQIGLSQHHALSVLNGLKNRAISQVILLKWTAVSLELPCWYLLKLRWRKQQPISLRNF